MSSPTKRDRNPSLETANRPPVPKRASKDKMAHSSSKSPFMPMFESFQAELDEHHDRRERVIKASRDVTANSKKVIFSLQRVPVTSLAQLPLPAQTQKSIDPYLDTINTLLTSIVADLQGINAWRYQRQASPGIQEFVEAAAFRHYLTTQRLITISETQALLPEGIRLTEDDWILGIFDTVGEMMRWGITGIATSGKLPGMDPESAGESRDVLQDLRELRVYLETINAKGSGFARDLPKKMEVMKTCVEKVENATYGLVVRGKERPPGWVPEAREEVKVGIESY